MLLPTHQQGGLFVTSKGLRECLEKRTRKRKHSPILRGNNKKRAPTPLPAREGRDSQKRAKSHLYTPPTLYAYLKTLSRSCGVLA